MSESPVMYSVMLAGHGFVATLFVWSAAGYDPADFFALFGLGWLDSLCLA